MRKNVTEKSTKPPNNKCTKNKYSKVNNTPKQQMYYKNQ